MADFLLILFVIFLLFSVFRRYIFFFVMNAITRNIFKNDGGMHGQHRSSGRPEGHVHIDDRGVKKKNNPLRDQGEYIDYEEVKD